MKNQKKNSEVKNPTTGQPSYEDQPWQVPQFGQKDSKKDPQDDCGCGSDKGNKTTKRH